MFPFTVKTSKVFNSKEFVDELTKLTTNSNILAISQEFYACDQVMTYQNQCDIVLNTGVRYPWYAAWTQNLITDTQAQLLAQTLSKDNHDFAFGLAARFMSAKNPAIELEPILYITPTFALMTNFDLFDSGYSNTEILEKYTTLLTSEKPSKDDKAKLAVDVPKFFKKISGHDLPAKSNHETMEWIAR